MSIRAARPHGADEARHRANRERPILPLPVVLDDGSRTGCIGSMTCIQPPFLRRSRIGTSVALDASLESLSLVAEVSDSTKPARPPKRGGRVPYECFNLLPPPPPPVLLPLLPPLRRANCWGVKGSVHSRFMTWMSCG